MSADIVIAYSGGTYGTYLHWALSTLTEELPILDPFTHNGTSHKFNGTAFDQIDHYQMYLKNAPEHGIVRIHPKSKKTESLDKNMDLICSSGAKVFYLYPNRDSILLVINNYFEKVWEDWWTYQFQHSIPQEKIYTNWPVDLSVPIENIPNWIKREFLSFYLMPSWFDQIEWFHPDKWDNSQCQIVYVNDLLFNFESTMTKILEFAEINTVRPVNTLRDSHERNVRLQTHINQDSLCSKIVNSVLSDTIIDWKDFVLPLASQAYIQWQLRNNGFEIRCDGLDYFPDNSVQLKDLLYQPNT